MYQVPETMKLSQNFDLKEFACKDGTKQILVDWELVKRLQILRDTVNKPVVITSAYRTVAYNKKVGGVPNSFHVQGKAADVKVAGMTPLQIAKLADSLGFLGIGVYPTFTHVDTGGNGKGKKLYWKQDNLGNKTIVGGL